MKTRVAILLGAPLTQQNLERIQAQKLSNEFDAVIVDCATWIHPASIKAEYEKISWNNLVVIASFNELTVFLRNNEFDFAIDFIGDVPERYEIAKLLGLNKTKLVIQKLSPIPLRLPKKARLVDMVKKAGLVQSNIGNPEFNTKPEAAKSSFQRILAMILTRTLINKIFTSAKIRMVNPYFIVQIEARFRHIDSMFAKKVIRGGSLDFHSYARVVNELNYEESIAGKYVVFLDDCLVEALDWQTLGITPPIDRESYFISLNNYFEQIEETFGVPVVIAGHPNTRNNPTYGRNFESRKVVYSKSCELVLESELVLIHASTAVSFAVLGNKPVVSLTSRNISQSRIGRQVEAFSHALGSQLVDIDEGNFIFNIPKVNKSKYRKYTNRYIKNSKVSESHPLQNLIHLLTLYRPNGRV